MDRLYQLAEVSVARGCGFAALAIGTTMVALSFDPLLAGQAGAVLVSIMAAVLWMRSINALTHPYRRTELWVLLDKADQPAPAQAQQIIGVVLQVTYRRYALRSTQIAVGFWIGVALLMVIF